MAIDIMLGYLVPNSTLFMYCQELTTRCDVHVGNLCLGLAHNQH